MLTQLLNKITCDKCSIPMEEVRPGEYFCENGHGKVLLDLVPASRREEIERRSRKVDFRCPVCNEITVLKKKNRKGQKMKLTYECGHHIWESLSIPSERDERWNDFYPFQQEGIEFMELGKFNILLGDEMGLGKTIQFLGCLRYNYAQMTPCLMICEASKVYDWQSEFKSWIQDRYDGVSDEPIIHTRGKLPLCGGFKNHIISMSLLQKPKVLKSIINYGFKCVMVDECHSFKNLDTKRTAALQQICESIPKHIFLSGTPIQNKVMEYFVPLNILKPEVFHSESYLRNKCDISSTGRILGLNSWHRPRFFKSIEDIVIRRTKRDAGIELPNIRMNKHKVAISSSTDADTIKGYNNILDEIERRLDSKRNDAMSCTELLGFMATLRHLTGLAKVKPVIQMVNEFLESTDSTDKICIGVHHKSVMDMLVQGLREYDPLTISSESPERKMRIIEDFKKPDSRILIASILGAGQGLNLQFCKNAIIAERQWNPSKEDQFIGRFHRIETDPLTGKLKVEFDDASDSVTIDILNASGFIDEFLDPLVEMKHHIVDATNDDSFPYSQDFLIDLCRKLVQNRPQLPSLD